MVYLREKLFSQLFVPCFDFNEKACYNGFPCISCFSAFVPFHACLVNVFIIVSNDELSRSCMFWVFREKWKIFTRKLPNIIYYTEFYKITLRHVKTATLYLYLEQELHGDEIFYKPCFPLGNIIWR